MTPYFSLVLHAHLPYVLHEEPDRLEERWMYEAVTETYIPLIWGFEKSTSDTRYTLSISPPVLEMLANELFQERYLQYLDRTLELLEKEQVFTEVEEELDVIQFYYNRFKKIKQTFMEWNCNLISAFRYYVQEEKAECITSTATHAFLPYIQTEQGVRAQIVYGLQCFEHHFGFKPDGIWLPECAFTPGLDKILYEEGVRYTFVDEETVRTLEPKPDNIHAPVYSPHGIVLFPRRMDLSKKVWDSNVGYPGDYDYREFYRDVGYDRNHEYILPYIHPDGIRIDTGLKYHRITGKTDAKDYYRRNWALGKVEQHAKDFVRSIRDSFTGGREDGRQVLSLTSFDAELFGHWWFEGPEWIERLQAYSSQENIEWITPAEFVKRHHEELSTHHACFSTWGRNNYGEVWLNESNEWIYRHLHAMETELIKQFAEVDSSDAFNEKVLTQMTREWLLATSSDWAFIMDHETTSEYAASRTKEHIQAFYELNDILKDSSMGDDQIKYIEERFGFMNWLEPMNLSSEHDAYVISNPTYQEKRDGLNILMLSWEFPPMVVGGLSRHVFDLSKALVEQGHQVFVVTCAVDGYPEYEINQGVHVYRVKGSQPNHDDFYHWAGSLNLAMANLGRQLGSQISFDCIHAHDWIVSVAAKGLKHQLNLPLYVTIHATEHGRNNGIHDDMQAAIHHKEWELMYEAEHIIVCSAYMKQELEEVFEVPADKISILPNGVDPLLIPEIGGNEDWKHKYGHPDDFYIFSLGRVVPEKGFQYLIEAASMLRNDYPDIRFIIAGKGPLLEDYRKKVREYQLEDKVYFVGFVTDEERNQFLRQSDALIFPSSYEPFGIVAIEGMAAQTPIIVSDTGGLGDIVQHGKNGLKVFPGNAESIRDQIVALYNDPELGERLVQAASEDVNTKYNWTEIAVKTTEVLSGAVKKPKTVGVK